MKGNMEEIDNSRMQIPEDISERPKEQESLVAERCWLVGEIENAASRNADYLQVKYKVNGVICKRTVDINKWKHDNIMKRCEVIKNALNVLNFEEFVKDEDLVELIYVKPIKIKI